MGGSCCLEFVFDGGDNTGVGYTIAELAFFAVFENQKDILGLYEMSKLTDGRIGKVEDSIKSYDRTIAELAAFKTEYAAIIEAQRKTISELYAIAKAQGEQIDAIGDTVGAIAELPGMVQRLDQEQKVTKGKVDEVVEIIGAQ